MYPSMIPIKHALSHSLIAGFHSGSEAIVVLKAANSKTAVRIKNVFGNFGRIAYPFLQMVYSSFKTILFYEISQYNQVLLASEKSSRL